MGEGRKTGLAVESAHARLADAAKWQLVQRRVRYAAVGRHAAARRLFDDSTRRVGVICEKVERKRLLVLIDIVDRLVDSIHLKLKANNQ